MKLFRTPLEQYKALKENLCFKYSNENAWGNETSGKRSMAYHALIYFLKQSEDLVEVDEALEEEIYYENVKLLLGTEIRLPNSLIRSMKGSFYLQPFENFTEKYSELIGDLRSKTKFLDRHLTDLTKSRHETNPFPYMKGLPDGDHGDFEKVDFYADEVNNKFANYLYENMLFSSLDESDSDAKSLEAEFEESSEHGSANENCSSLERFSAKLRRLRGTIYQKIGKEKNPQY
jgi:hypothetical protein